MQKLIYCSFLKHTLQDKRITCFSCKSASYKKLRVVYKLSAESRYRCLLVCGRPHVANRQKNLNQLVMMPPADN